MSLVYVFVGGCIYVYVCVSVRGREGEGREMVKGVAYLSRGTFVCHWCLRLCVCGGREKGER